MNAPATALNATTDAVNDAIAAGCNSIAPNWPLDRMIAVSPYWERVNRPFAEVAATLAELAGSPMTMPLDYYQAQWQAGHIQAQHLAKALAEQKSTLSVEQLVAALQQTSHQPVPAPLLCDTLDGQRDLLHEPAWCDTITHQIAQFCAAYFDRAQADWRPDQAQDLYASWRNTLSRDHSVALLMKAADIPTKAAKLAETPQAQIALSLQQLSLEPEDWPHYLQAVILRISGWASWCAYRRWQAKLAGSTDDTLVDLLAIRLSWESLIDTGERYKGSVWNRWQGDWREHFSRREPSALAVPAFWQRAHEISYQQQLTAKLLNAPGDAPQQAPKVQAVFCIDVRSEVFRRHLEAQSADIQTLGFAGFFGLPISYTPIGTSANRPQLPGLLAPALEICDSTGCSDTDQKVSQLRQGTLKNLFSWRPFQTMPASAFTLVETLGLGYAGKLIKRSIPAAGAETTENSLGLSHKHTVRPSLKTALANDLKAQTDIAASVLTGMNLKEGLAPWVLLIGHGSQNQNNPQRAGLDCGACCGQTGEVNSRALAALLNDAEVRAALAERQIQIAESTRFVAALHNTTTDEINLFDTDLLPASHHSELEEIKGHLVAAGLAARQERAPLLGLADLVNKPEKLTKAVKQRANDWAQTRPEWGLANNAAFVIAPRSRTHGVNLAGRSFLHDYDYHKDSEGTLLELIMTAPMIVTHWINMQYYASTADNPRYGSGNKTLHNVVGGRLGVFEGNGGDLRIGLAWQSVHDGDEWRHEPLRLNVVIDAPRAAIERVINKHEMVSNLLDNQWLYLMRIDDNGIEAYNKGSWQTCKH